jgi:DNA-binding PadR family transcriptional regulator
VVTSLEIDKFYHQILDLLNETAEGIHFNLLKRKTGFNPKTLSTRLRNLLDERLIEVTDNGKGRQKIYRITEKGRWELRKAESYAYFRTDVFHILASQPTKEHQTHLLMTPSDKDRYKRNLIFLFYPSEETQEMAQKIFYVEGEGSAAKASVKKRLERLNNLIRATIENYASNLYDQA